MNQKLNDLLTRLDVDPASVHIKVEDSWYRAHIAGVRKKLGSAHATIQAVATTENEVLDALAEEIKSAIQQRIIVVRDKPLFPGRVV